MDPSVRRTGDSSFLSSASSATTTSSSSMSPSEAYLGEISPSRCVLMVCDVQTRFGPSVMHFGPVVENVARLVRAAKVAGVSVLATEQYPKVRQAPFDIHHSLRL